MVRVSFSAGKGSSEDGFLAGMPGRLLGHTGTHARRTSFCSLDPFEAISGACDVLLPYTLLILGRMSGLTAHACCLCRAPRQADGSVLSTSQQMPEVSAEQAERRTCILAA